MQLAFCAGPGQRAARARTDRAWMERALNDAASRFIIVSEGEIAVRRDGADVTLALVERHEHASLGGDGDVMVIHDGGDNGVVFAGECRRAALEAAMAADARLQLANIRTLAIEGAMAPSQLGLAALARSLVEWHRRNRFCANCGAASRVVDGGYRRHCEACGGDHFPRTDPVAIMVVRDGERVLLGRGHNFPDNVYSALAGFIEPGETIEQAAAREVREETGIEVAGVRYVASQPWPFPSSLMIGLICEAVGGDLDIDGNELADGRWFSRAEALAMLEGRHEQGLTAPPPMAIAHLLLAEALKA